MWSSLSAKVLPIFRVQIFICYLVCEFGQSGIPYRLKPKENEMELSFDWLSPPFLSEVSSLLLHHCNQIARTARREGFLSNHDTQAENHSGHSLWQVGWGSGGLLQFSMARKQKKKKTERNQGKTHPYPPTTPVTFSSQTPPSTALPMSSTVMSWLHQRINSFIRIH